MSFSKYIWNFLTKDTRNRLTLVKDNLFCKFDSIVSTLFWSTSRLSPLNILLRQHSSSCKICSLEIGAVVTYWYLVRYTGDCTVWTCISERENNPTKLCGTVIHYNKCKSYTMIAPMSNFQRWSSVFIKCDLIWTLETLEWSRFFDTRSTINWNASDTTLFGAMQTSLLFSKNVNIPKWRYMTFESKPW